MGAVGLHVVPIPQPARHDDGGACRGGQPTTNELAAAKATATTSELAFPMVAQRDIVRSIVPPSARG